VPHHPEATGDALDGIAERRRLALARLLSIIFNPLFAGIATYLVVGLFLPGGLVVGLGWAGLALVVQVLPPMTYYLVRLRQGAFSDPDVSVRQERNELYVFGTVSVLLTIAALRAVGAPVPLLALALGTLAVAVVCGLVNLVWKISMHAAGMGSLATVALLHAPALGAMLWATAALVGWARVRTRNHTPRQVIAGFAVAALVMSGAFALVRG
jgi:membrane-associated phospholipid phosphatase